MSSRTQLGRAEVTVIGAGLAGLVAATECAERGLTVDLFEARGRLGGRAWTAGGAWHANYGPHVLYADGVLWEWLRRRGLHRDMLRAHSQAIRYRWKGRTTRTRPHELVAAFDVLHREPPVDEDFRSWLAPQVGEEAASALSSLAGSVTFDHEPGRLSAAFVAPRLRRVGTAPLAIARYPVGGWGCLIEAIAQCALDRGVRVETSSAVTSLPTGPVIVAVQPQAARRLLDVDAPRDRSRVATLDVGIARATALDAYVVRDLDEAGVAERVSAVDPTVAPVGHALIQGCTGLEPHETMEDGVTRVERLLDAGWPGWRSREVWRRRGAVEEATGALDLPGTVWQERPAVEQADGIWLCGDWVAAPGHLAEVSVQSAMRAAELASEAVHAARRQAACFNAHANGASAGMQRSLTIDSPTETHVRPPSLHRRNE